MASTDLPATPATLVQQIAGNVLSVAAAAIPLEVVEHTKALIVDSIGCALAATEEPAFARASRVLAQLGGNPDCTVIGSSRRVNLPQAVLLNGILIRSLDLNDAYMGPGQMGHPSDNIAVSLSVGEKFRASGLSVIASVALGYEIYCRMQDIIPARGAFDRRPVDGIERGAACPCGRAVGHAWQHARRRAHRAAGQFQSERQRNGGIPSGTVFVVCRRGHDRSTRGDRTAARAEHWHARRGKIRSSRSTDRRTL